MEHIYRLYTIKGIGPKLYTKLVKHFGSAQEVFEASHDSIARITGEKIAKEIKNTDGETLHKLRETLKRHQIRVIDFTCDEYPQTFRTSEIFPPVLFLSGKKLEVGENTISIVGTRKPTWYGIETAKNLTRQLVSHGFSIISGGARGIDTIAHTTAVANNGYTIVVLGCGLDFAYPPENMELFKRIKECGTMVSEFPPGTKPHRENFPKRNRLIAGLAKGVLIIEAGEKSGALITAKWALELGKEVYAVPGPINSLQSKGTNLLIKDGAQMVTEINDILKDFGIRASSLKDKEKEPLTPIEEKVLSFLDSSPTPFDLLCEKTQLPVHELLSILFEMEIKNLIRELPGKFFVKSN